MIELMALEFRRMMREPEFKAAMAVTIALVIAGAWQGNRFARDLTAKQARAIAQEGERIESLKAKVADVESGRVNLAADTIPRTDPRVAVSFALSGGAPMAVLPVPPLAGLAVGQSDLSPSMVSANLMNRSTIYAAQEFIADAIVHPSELQAGHFDFAFVAVILLPLIALALSFAIVSGERESGTLSLALSQPVDPRKLIWTRLAIRWMALSTACISVLAAYLFVAGVFATPVPWAGFVIAAVAVACYLAVWFALGLAVSRFGGHSASNAAILGAVWVAWTLVVPALIDSVSSAAAPPPSRSKMVVELREISNRLSQDAKAAARQFYLQHPELLQNAQVPDVKMFYNRFYAIQQMTDESIRPVIEEQDRMRREHDVYSTRLAWLSPSLLLQQILNAVAGNDFNRHARFMEAVHGYRDRARRLLEPKVFGQRPLELQDFDRLGRFDFKEEPSGELMSRTLPVIAAMALMAAALVMIGLVGMNRTRLLSSSERNWVDHKKRSG